MYIAHVKYKLIKFLTNVTSITAVASLLGLVVTFYNPKGEGNNFLDGIYYRNFVSQSWYNSYKQFIIFLTLLFILITLIIFVIQLKKFKGFQYDDWIPTYFNVGYKSKYMLYDSHNHLFINYDISKSDEEMDAAIQDINKKSEKFEYTLLQRDMNNGELIIEVKKK